LSEVLDFIQSRVASGAIRSEFPGVERIRTVDVASVLRRRIHWGIHLSLVRIGDRLPSLRAVAAEFGVDQRSVLAAYRLLVAEGLVEMRTRSGIYVVGAGSPLPQVPPDKAWIVDTFLAGASHGVPPAALASTLQSALRSRPLTAACVESNADSLLGMASQLRGDYGLATSWIDPAVLSDERARHRLSRSDLIVTTQFYAREAVEAANAVNRPLIVTAADRDYTAQLRSALGRGPTYFIGVDQRFADRMEGANDGARWMANMRPIIASRNESIVIPPGAPTFVTRAAAEMLGPDALPRGAVVLTHLLSNDTRAAILNVILAASIAEHEPDDAVKSTAVPPVLVDEEGVPGMSTIMRGAAAYAEMLTFGADPSEIRARCRSLVRGWVGCATSSATSKRAELSDLVLDVVTVFHQLTAAGLISKQAQVIERDFIAWTVEDYQEAIAAR
jgi:hypothetical protein